MEMIGDYSNWIAMVDRPGERCAPLLRRKFTISASIASATLSISGLGYYEAWINGLRVGDHVLDLDAVEL